jgi:hypothetical protein
MKKAFDANVSRAKPRVRLGSLMTDSGLSAATVESLAQQVAHEAPVIPSFETVESMDLHNPGPPPPAPPRCSRKPSRTPGPRRSSMSRGLRG